MIATTLERESNRPLVLHTRVVTGVGGGPEKTILNSPRILDQLGYSAVCAFMHPPHDPGFQSIENRAREQNAELLSITDRGPFDRTVLSRLRDYCIRKNVKVWHAHDYKSNLIGVLLRKRLNLKLVTTVHGWVKRTWKTPLYYAIDRWTLKRYERVICVSTDLEDRCRQLGVEPKRLVQIDNGIDTAAYQATMSRDVAKKTIGIPDDCLLISAIGRLSPEKGFDRLIDVVGQLVKQKHNVFLAIAGDGDHAAALTRRIEDLQLEQRVRLLGYVPDPRVLLTASDVFVLSSLREGLPNVILEAMASRRAIVATEIAGVPRAITHRVSGLLVPAGDNMALEQALQETLQSEELRNRLGQAAFTAVNHKFSFSRRMQRIAEIYDELLTDARSNKPLEELATPSRSKVSKI